MAKVREKKKRERRRRILEAAKTLWKDQGYHRVSIKRIAQASGVSDRTVYNYFMTKPGILSSLIQIEVEDVLNGLEDKKKPSSGSAAQVVTEFLRGYEAVLATHERLMWREFLSAALADPEGLGDWIKDVDSRLRGQLEAIFEDLLQSGSLKKAAKPADLALVVRDACLTRVIQHATDDKLTTKKGFANLRQRLEALLSN